MDPKLEKQIREIFQNMFEENYASGVPRIPPHQHNGIDNLKIKASNIVGLRSSSSSGSGGTPAGNNTDVQFNDNGAFGGDDGFTYDFNTQYVGLINVTNVPGNDIDIQTDYADSTSNTHNIIIQSGDSDNDNSGDLTLLTGDANLFNRVGDITIATGNDSSTGQRGGTLTLIGGGVSVVSNAENQGITMITNRPGGSVFVGANDTTGFIGLSSGGNAQVVAGVGPLDLYVIDEGEPIRIDYGTGQSIITLGPDGVAANGMITLDANSAVLIKSRNTGRVYLHDLPSNAYTANLGNKILYMADAGGDPADTAASGGVLYVNGGALKYKGSGGTVTTIAPA